MLRSILVPVVILSLCVVFGCEKITGKVEPNIPPTIRFVNVPPEMTAGDTTVLKHGKVVYWEAHDVDGYIMRYDWAYKDTTRWNHLYTDSTYSDSASATQHPIPFYIPEDDTFVNGIWVRAVDNDEAFSEVITRTYKAHGNAHPFDIQILGADSGEIMFILPEITNAWSGIEFGFTVVDTDSVLPPEFRWRWDDNIEWSDWSRDQIYYAVGTDIFSTPPPYETGFHTLHVRCRDDSEREACDSLGVPDIAELRLKLVYPTFDKGILLIDETWDSRAFTDDDTIDAFYEQLVLSGRPVDVLDFSEAVGSPMWKDSLTPEDLGVYSMLIYYNDELSRQALENWTELLGAYFDVGGSAWLIGGRNLQALESGVQFWLEWGEQYLGMSEFTPQAEKDFVGARSTATSSWDLRIDSLKAGMYPLAQPWYPGGKLPWIETVELTGSGTKALFTFDSDINDPDFEGKTCGWKYDSGSHRVVVFTFPLYWTEWDPVTGEPAKSIADDVLGFLEVSRIKR